MKAIWNGTVVAESDATRVVEGNHYFPPDSVKREYFKDSGTTSTCPWKGEAIVLHASKSTARRTRTQPGTTGRRRTPRRRSRTTSRSGGAWRSPSSWPYRTLHPVAEPPPPLLPHPLDPLVAGVEKTAFYVPGDESGSGDAVWVARAQDWAGARPPPGSTSRPRTAGKRAEAERLPVGLDDDVVAFGEVAAEDLHREGVLDHALDGALQGPGAEDRVVALLGEPGLGCSRAAWRR